MSEIFLLNNFERWRDPAKIDIKQVIDTCLYFLEKLDRDDILDRSV